MFVHIKYNIIYNIENGQNVFNCLFICGPLRIDLFTTLSFVARVKIIFYKGYIYLKKKK